MDQRFLTQFEITKLVSVRTRQLEEGSEPVIEVEEGDDTIDIAMKELHSKVIPIKIKRSYPNGQEVTLDPNKMICVMH